MMNRRDFITYAPVVLAAPAILGVPQPGAPHRADRLEALTMELSELLNDTLYGGFRAIVEPSALSRSPIWLQNTQLRVPGMTDADRVDFAVHSLSEAMKRLDPTVRGSWSVHDMEGEPIWPRGRLVGITFDRGKA